MMFAYKYVSACGLYACKKQVLFLFLLVFLPYFCRCIFTNGAMALNHLLMLSRVTGQTEVLSGETFLSSQALAAILGRHPLPRK